MRKHKFLKSAILMGAICLLTVLAFTTEKADAWGWTGFSSLCVEGKFRGPDGETIVFTLKDVTIHTQCYNKNTGNLSQPGEGNWGILELEVGTEPVSGKTKGVVSINGCIDLSRWDTHSLHEEDEDHTCYPYDNINKEELSGSGWISEFTATWVWYKADGTVKNEGTDICEWTGEIIDGFPTEADFDCPTQDSLKKIKWVLEE